MNLTDPGPGPEGKIWTLGHLIFHGYVLAESPVEHGDICPEGFSAAGGIGWCHYHRGLCCDSVSPRDIFSHHRQL